MKKIQTTLAGAALAALIAPAIAAPVMVEGTTLSIYDLRAPNAEGALIGSTAAAGVAAERQTFEQKLAAGYRTESFDSAPYDVEATGSPTEPFYAAKALSSGFGVLGGGALSLESGVGAGVYYVDTQLTQPLGTGGRYDPTSAACSADPANEAAIEACTARWFEASGVFTIDFGDAFGAFGFYGTDFGDFRGTLKMDLLDASGDLVRSFTFDPFADSLNGALGFFGFMDSQAMYHGVRIVVEQSGDNVDYFGFDDLILGQVASDPNPNPVPEPGSLALVGASLLALTAARRRRGAHKA